MSSVSPVSRASTGMTLLEVVVSIALLAAIAVVVLPILVDATKATAPIVDSIEPSELRRLLDTHLADEAAFAPIRTAGELDLLLGDEGAERVVHVKWLRRDDASRPHDWLEATCGSTRVLRYVPRPSAAASSIAGEEGAGGGEALR